MDTAKTKPYHIPTGTHYYQNLNGTILVRVPYDNQSEAITAVNKCNPGVVVTCLPGSMQMEMANETINLGIEVSECEYFALANL